MRGEMPDDLAAQIRTAYKELATEYGPSPDVAVRSSATAEDLPTASFAGQQETYLNIRGADNLLTACKRVFASLFTNRAISYRVDQGFAHMDVALSIGVQKMVRSDKGASGVMFTLDTETGFRDVVFINAAYGLGENVVQGTVNPDEFYVFKTTLAQGHRPILKRQLGSKERKLIYAADAMAGVSTRNIPVKREDRERFAITDDEVLQLARYAITIENHYSQQAGHPMPMDIEWAKDGESGELFILQARPETVHATQEGGHGDLSPATTRHRAGRRQECRPEDRRRPGAGDPRGRTHGRIAAGRGIGHRYHRSRLGAGNEDRRRHRHQSRRAYLPCRHRRP